jgi:hypothetical protein
MVVVKNFKTSKKGGECNRQKLKALGVLCYESVVFIIVCVKQHYKTKHKYISLRIEEPADTTFSVIRAAEKNSRAYQHDLNSHILKYFP